MATLETWRKAYGALKDRTKVGLAHVNSNFADLDIAVVKATNHVDCPPKDRHLRKILIATSAARPRADVAYCIHTLSRRLGKTHNWTVALKTLIVIHRLLREGDPTFKEELLNFSSKGRILQLSNFKDDSSPIAWDCSAWVRTYAQFLVERLECFKILKYDIEAERLPVPAQGQDKGYGKTQDVDSGELLERLPALQHLLYRLMGCRPEGAAVGNYLIQYALALVLKESFKIYCAINDGIINLVDKFFEMPRHEAVKALEIYKRAGQQAGNLLDFYEICKGLEQARNFQFPVLREPPQSFIATMEEYVKEAPRAVTIPTVEPLLQLTYHPEASEEDTNVPVEEPKPVPLEDVAAPVAEIAPPPPPLATQSNFDTEDLLGLNDNTTDPFAIEENNALAPAIIPAGPELDSSTAQVKDFDPTGWELALVTTPGTNISVATERQLAGGLDTLTLNSLYDGVYRASQQPVYGAPAPNPFEIQDSFASSRAIAVPATVEMAQQQALNPFTPHQPQPQPIFEQEQHPMAAPSNPFGDAGFSAFPQNNVVHHPQSSNPFGSTDLL